MIASREILRLSSNECQFRLFSRLVTEPGSLVQQFFTNLAALRWKCRGSVFFSKGGGGGETGVPHTAGIFQARTHKGDVGLAFDTLRAGVKVVSKEIQGPFGLSYNVFNVIVPTKV